MKIHVIGILICLLLSAHIGAQEPLELVQRREELLRNLQRASIPVYEAYLKSLEPLKAQYAREKNL